MVGSSFSMMTGGGDCRVLSDDVEGWPPLCHALPHANVYHNHHQACDALQKSQHILVGTYDATIVTKLIVHVVPLSGCVALATLFMYWMSRTVVTESFESALTEDSKVQHSGIALYHFLSSKNYEQWYHLKALVLLYKIGNFILI